MAGGLMNIVKGVALGHLICCLPISAQTLSGKSSRNDSVRPQNISASLITEIRDRHHLAEDLEYLTDVIGPRLTGSAKLVQAHDWVEKTLRARGLTKVRRESYRFGPTFVRGRATATLLSHAKIDLAIAQLGWSPGTKGSVRAELFAQQGNTATEIASQIGQFGGKIILAGPLPASSAADSATLIRVAQAINDEGALAYLRESDKPLGLSMGGSPQWVNPRRPVIPTGILSKEGYALLKRLSTRGERVTLELNLPGTVSKESVDAFNSMGEINAPGRSEEVVIIAAHLDSWDLATGATDDGVGVVAVIEALRAIKALPHTPRRTIRGLFFSGEEQGEFGARAYIQQHQRELSNVQAVLVVDVGAGRVKGWALQRPSEQSVMLMRSAIMPLTKMGVSEVVLDPWPGSDPRPFGDAGIPTFAAVQEADDYFSITHHSEFDTFTHVKPDNLLQIATALAVTAWELANMTDRFPHVRLPSNTR
jgi:carboxypeptidase Q